MKKIYDSFLFFNELDLLEIRLTMLDPYVDYFVISECDYTFSGNEKPFNFENNKHLFDKFIDKIIYVKHYDSNKIDGFINNYVDNKKELLENIIKNFIPIKNSPETDYGKGHWCRDYLHREYVGLGLVDCKDDDIIIFSDLDEIPKPEIIKDCVNFDFTNKNYCVYMDAHQYFINNLSSTNWMGSVITTYGKLKTDSLCNLRRIRSTYGAIENGGWHLSFMGGVEKIKEKIESYGHQEFNNDYIKGNINNKINQNSDLFNRSNRSTSPNEIYYFDRLKEIPIEGYYPSEILELINNKFPYLIKK